MVVMKRKKYDRCALVEVEGTKALDIYFYGIHIKHLSDLLHD